jgi:hypothetical protein
MHKNTTTHWTPDSSWIAEFGEAYAVPVAILQAGLNDSSWHNDVAPSFMLPADADGDNAIDAPRLWVNHPDPDQREMGAETPRFFVTSEETENPYGTDYAGEDIDAAIRALRTASERHAVAVIADKDPVVQQLRQIEAQLTRIADDNRRTRTIDTTDTRDAITQRIQHQCLRLLGED